MTRRLYEFGKSSLEAAAQLQNASERSGLAVDSLSRLKYVAEQNDISFEGLTESLKRWQVSLSQASTGADGTGQALKILQLNATQLKSLTLDEQLRKIADQFARIQSPADQTRIAVELFGRAGEQLVPLLAKGGGAIADLEDEADRLGITLDEKTTESIDRAEKALRRFFTTLQSSAAKDVTPLLEAFLPPTTNIEAMERTLQRFKDDRNAFLRGAANFLPADQMKKELDILDARIANQQKAIKDMANADAQLEADNKKNPLAVPDTSPISEVIVNQQKAQLQGLAKLLDDFEKKTRTSDEKIYQDYKDTVAQVEELTKAHVISETEAAKRIGDARLKYEQDITIEPIDLNQIEKQRVVIQKTLSEQQRSVDIFVDTVKDGLNNLAQAGELTGRSILKYLLASFESKALKDAIDGLGRYLKQSLGGSAGGAGSLIGSFIDAIFGSDYISPVTVTAQRVPVHAAGGGSIGGARVVGEDGPELELSNGRILNKRQLAFAMAGSGAPNVNIQQGNVIIQGNADTSTVQAFQAAMAANNRKLIEQMNLKLKETYGRAPR